MWDAEKEKRLNDLLNKKSDSKSKKDVVSEKSKLELRENTVLVLENDLEKLTALSAALERNKYWCFDVETDGAHFILAKLEGIGFYLPDNESCYYINFYKCSQMWIDTVISTLKVHFENMNIGKMGHNISYDMHVMKNYGVDVKGKIFDTMIACWLINPDDRPLKLKTLVPRHLKIEMRTYDSIDKENILDMAIYCMEDVRCTFLLSRWCKEHLIKDNLWKLFNDVEMPFLRVLFNMERRGIRVDVDRVIALRAEYEQKVEKLKLDFCEKLFGCRSDKVLIDVIKKVKGISKKESVQFNINSGPHLAVVFFNMKKYPTLSKTKGGKASTDKHALSRLAEAGYDGLDILLEYRSLETLLKNFIRPILDTHMISGRVYPSFLQFGTRTGRLSSSKPNFQNIPVRSREGKAIRRCFIADEGYKIIDSDLSQIELRIMAHYSEDAQLIKAYKENIDLHDLTSQLVFGYPPGFSDTDLHPENKATRTLCKNLNFGLSYGAGSRKFAFLANIELAGIDKEEKETGKFIESHKITENQAKEFIEKYFNKFSGIKKLQMLYPKEVKRVGYATTILGRRRYLPAINFPKTNKEGWKKASAAERAALSTLIQGTASDVIKLAMIRADQKGLKLAVQIHDQLLVYSKIENVEKDKETLRDCMENCGLVFCVPIKAKIVIVDRWEQESENAKSEEFENISLSNTTNEEPEVVEDE